jgi:hypothetical protein
MDVRSTKKTTLERINDPVRKWGFSSINLVVIVFSMLLISLILFYISKIAVIIFITAYVYFIGKISKWMRENQKKGLMNPISDKIEFLSMNKYYEQKLDYKKIYEKK